VLTKWLSLLASRLQSGNEVDDLGYTPSFLNVLITDARKFGVEQKSKMFYSLIRACLRDQKKVNVIVPVTLKTNCDVLAIYKRCFSEFEGDSLFKVVSVVDGKSRLGRVVPLLFLAMRLFISGSKVEKYRWRLNSAYTLAAQCRRHFNFVSFFDRLGCQHWIGLSGNIELLSLRARAKELSSTTTVSAIQFGQASSEQWHFKYYRVDKFFTYDKPALEMYSELGVDTDCLVQSGSPEFEDHLEAVNNDNLISAPKLAVLFIDQPIGQRAEFSDEYLEETLYNLRAISGRSDIDFYVKSHPRGSAFSMGELAGLPSNDNIAELISKSHMVIGFCSNLCDLALLCNRPVFYIGADNVLSDNKIRWIKQRNGKIIDDILEVIPFIDLYVDNLSPLLQSVLELNSEVEVKPSEVILKNLEASVETKI